jgi:hypothetical protein
MAKSADGILVAHTEENLFDVKEGGDIEGGNGSPGDL